MVVGWNRGRGFVGGIVLGSNLGIFEKDEELNDFLSWKIMAAVIIKTKTDTGCI